MKRIIGLLTLCIILGACNHKKMDKNTFWQLIETAKERSGTDMDMRYEILVSMLSGYEGNEIRDFGQIAGAYMYAAEENLAVWAACKAIEGYASDDTFLYFCGWLVSQGEDIYTQAVKNPESLATEETARYEYHEFEMLMYAPVEAYERKTGRSLYEDFEATETEAGDLLAQLLEGIEFADDTPFRESEIEAKRQIPVVLPRLTAMFGYDAEAEVAEMEALMSNPEAAKAMLEELKKTLQEQGVDISQLPGFEEVSED